MWNRFWDWCPELLAWVIFFVAACPIAYLILQAFNHGP